MAAQRLRAIVLDFDGVVVESNDVKTEAFEAVFARFPEHYDAMMAFHRAHVSVTRYAKFDHLLERLGKAGDETLRADLAADYSRRTIERIARVPLVAGAEAFLRDVTTQVPVYLASVTPAEDLDAILERRGLRGWFRGTYGCPPWTKSAAIRDVVKRERCEAAEALLIGDSAGDQKAAAETGVDFIARDSGLPFDVPTPRAIFRDLTRIADHIEERLR